MIDICTYVEMGNGILIGDNKQSLKLQIHTTYYRYIDTSRLSGRELSEVPALEPKAPFRRDALLIREP